jgi:hypothetical protein
VRRAAEEKQTAERDDQGAPQLLCGACEQSSTAVAQARVWAPVGASTSRGQQDHSLARDANAGEQGCRVPLPLAGFQ